MIRYILLASFHFLLFHCARQGENPLPIEPIQILPDYDLEATSLEFRIDPEKGPTTAFRVGQDVWVRYVIKNLGLQTLSMSAISYSLRQNDKLVRSAVDEWGVWHGLSGSPLASGDSLRLGTSPPYSSRDWTFTQQPGIYELKLKVFLHPRYEEEDKDNNLFTLTVEVRE